MANVTIIVEIGGQVLDNATAQLSDEAMAFAIDAMCDSRGYSEEIVDSDGNHVSKARFFTWELRKYAEAQVKRYATKLAVQQALEQAEAMTGTVVVPE